MSEIERGGDELIGAASGLGFVIGLRSMSLELSSELEADRQPQMKLRSMMKEDGKSWSEVMEALT